ncbi:OLC1v1022715C1 [Oldenlandia corymbosa var. corymbosa]|uniref:OLC1v1022715C1 n=1 Tax=Oldenlandia corymbosa var. corymbosa TaxID=529605 RepID=A0AAV1BYF1_OLDCO|nr:OLC1v1022715C1 [Oldenlandia corymbosa var. corymbosa]
MKITGGGRAELQEGQSSRKLNPFQTSDLLLGKPVKSVVKPPRRKSKGSGNGMRLKKDLAGKKSSRPETPLLRWKFDEGRDDENEVSKVEEEKLSPEEGARRNGRKVRALVSSRKLAAELWRMQLPAVPADGGEKLGFQSADKYVGVRFHGQPKCKVHDLAAKDLVWSPQSVNGPRNGYLSKVETSLQLSNPAMEGATKWDPVGWKTSSEVGPSFEKQKHSDNEARTSALISALQTELEQARSQIHELESERRSSKKKLEHFLKKLSEEKAAWRSREHEKVRAIIDDIKADLSRERKGRQRLEIVNSKLVNELAEAKLTAKRYMQDYEKERKARELIEEVCDELAKEIGEDKAEVEALKRESMRLREEVDDERKMLQMAEVWREERVQMKLVDAKVALEERYKEMNRLIADLESFMSSRGAIQNSEDMRVAEILRQAATSVNIQDIREFTYEPPNSDDIFSVFEDVNFGDPSERQIEQCVAYSPASHATKIHTVSPEANNLFNKDRHASAYVDRSGTLEEEGSEWETVSHPGDQDSSYSPDGSDPSVSKHHRDSNVSLSGTEWEGNACEGTPITEISEVCHVPARQQLKKVSSISRLWRSYPSNGDDYKIISVDGLKGRLSNGRLSNGVSVSPDHGSGKGGLSPPDLAGEWSSPESGNPHITRGMKGCIEWPRGGQKHSLKSKLLEARMESQKVQLKHVLKQKI